MKIIDCATNQIIKTIRVEKYPSAFIHNPIKNRVYLAICYSETTHTAYESVLYVIRDEIGIQRSPILPFKRALKLFPNPKEAYLTLNYSDLESFKIYDVLGNLIRKEQGKGKIPLKGISSGVYIIKIRDGGREFS